MPPIATTIVRWRLAEALGGEARSRRSIVQPAQFVNQPEVHTERSLGPMIKVLHSSRLRSDVAQATPRHVTTAHRPRKADSRGPSWSALAFLAVVLCDTTPFGPHLECLTVNRWLGQGWQMRASGANPSASFVSPKTEGGCMISKLDLRAG